MIINRRLEIMFICCLGLLFPNANFILFIILLMFFLLNLMVNFFIFKDLKDNKKRQKEFGILDEIAEEEKRKFKNILNKIIYFVSIIGMCVIAIYLKSLFIITITFITVLVEVIKIKKIKQIIKENKSLE